MKKLKSFLDTLGHLHDSRIETILWRPTLGVLEFHFDDLYWNFEGTANYPGAKPGAIVLKGVESISFDLDITERSLNVLNFIAEETDAMNAKAVIRFWPSGQIIAKFRGADFPEIELKNP